MSKSPKRRLWTRPEQVRALELYFRTPFGRIHNRNPDIIALAKSLGLTASALSLKMVNFAALDPTIHQKGMDGFSKSDAAIWSEFFSAPSSFLEKISGGSVVGDIANPNYEQPISDDFTFEVREGTDILRTVKTRQNQSYFRKMLLVSYGGKCGLTGIAQPELLTASHIKPWASDIEARMDPRNGILLNSLHDRAFDKGMITFEDDLSLVVSKHLDLPQNARPFFSDRALNRPERFAPNPTYLKYHRDVIFESFST